MEETNMLTESSPEASHSALTLDVVIPTFRRKLLLEKALRSLFKARHPQGLAIRLLVVDNNSGDGTDAVVTQMQDEANVPLVYVLETRQGLSHARNAGIAASTADLIGFIDDDEQVLDDWFETIQREFQDPELDFIGGPYLPDWVCEAPDWLPPGYHSAIGAIPPRPRASFDTFEGNLMGGNAVLRRKLFAEIGTYAPHLGRSSKGLLSEEDAEFHRRLRAARKKGYYVPDLAILHYIAPERLTRRYHRRWVLWRGISQGLLDRELKEPVRYLFGIPRYKLGRALRTLLELPFHHFVARQKARAFADELASWDLAGFIYGKFFFRPERFYS